MKFLLLVAALLATPLAVAQQPDDAVLRSRVERVVEDVVVRDRSDHAIRDLALHNFTLTENSLQQQLLSLQWNDAVSLGYDPPPQPKLAANTFVNLPAVPERGPLYVILYDMVNMDPGSQAYSRKPLERLIEHMPEGTRVALFVNARGLHLAEGFTTDHARLLHDLTNPSAGNPIPRMFLDGQEFGRGNPGATLGVFHALAEYLAGFNGRKNLIWMSSRFPLTLSAAPMAMSDTQVSTFDSIRMTTAAMARAEIAIYPVSVDGVVVAGGIGQVGTAAVTGVSAPSSSPQANVPVSSTTSANRGTQPGSGSSTGGSIGNGATAMEEVANLTGGRSLVGNNDLERLFHTALDDGSSYYTLSYSPTDKTEDGREHRIGIHVDRPGLRLGYRTLYYRVAPAGNEGAASNDPGALPADVAAAENAVVGDSEFAAIEHGAPMVHDLVFSAHVEREGTTHVATADEMDELKHLLREMRAKEQRKMSRSDERAKPELLSNWRVRYEFYAPTAGDRFEFALVAYDRDGVMLNGALGGAASNDQNKGPRRAMRGEQTITAPARAAWLRIAVRDLTNGKTGAFEVQLGPEGQPLE